MTDQMDVHEGSLGLFDNIFFFLDLNIKKKNLQKKKLCYASYFWKAYLLKVDKSTIIP